MYLAEHTDCKDTQGLADVSYYKINEYTTIGGTEPLEAPSTMLQDESECS